MKRMSRISCGTASFQLVDGFTTTSFSKLSNAARASTALLHVGITADSASTSGEGSGLGDTTGSGVKVAAASTAGALTVGINGVFCGSAESAGKKEATAGTSTFTHTHRHTRSLLQTGQLRLVLSELFRLLPHRNAAGGVVPVRTAIGRLVLFPCTRLPYTHTPSVPSKITQLRTSAHRAYHMSWL